MSTIINHPFWGTTICGNLQIHAPKNKSLQDTHQHSLAQNFGLFPFIIVLGFVQDGPAKQKKTKDSPNGGFTNRKSKIADSANPR